MIPVGKSTLCSGQCDHCYLASVPFRVLENFHGESRLAVLALHNVRYQVTDLFRHKLCHRLGVIKVGALAVRTFCHRAPPSAVIYDPEGAISRPLDLGSKERENRLGNQDLLAPHIKPGALPAQVDEPMFLRSVYTHSFRLGPGRGNASSLQSTTGEDRFQPTLSVCTSRMLSVAWTESYLRLRTVPTASPTTTVMGTAITPQRSLEGVEAVWKVAVTGGSKAGFPGEIRRFCCPTWMSTGFVASFTPHASVSAR